MPLSDFFYRKVLDSFPFPPTGCQDNLFRTFSYFLYGTDCDILVINGYAGTGKTSAIAAVVSAMKSLGMRFRLMAPTGRAAKVLANYTGEPSLTIHKQIYRQKSIDNGFGVFTLDMNKDSDTCYIVDEASLITVSANGGVFGSGDLLDDMVSYVRSGRGNRLVIIGDDAQLPPVSLDRSPALDISYLETYGKVLSVTLETVVRQEAGSGILHNATVLRKMIVEGETGRLPGLGISGFDDVESISSASLTEALEDAMAEYGPDGTVVLCRSNRRANRYNAGIRSRILGREEELVRGDKLMIVKNCYQFLESVDGLDFIANGDIAEILKVSRYEQRYGLRFAEALLSFHDYGDVEIKAKIILDTLASESASLTPEQQAALYEGVYADYDGISTKRKRNAAVREDVYYNALQIKYASAITCHKSQGGQWDAVFIDNPFWKEDVSLEDLKWLYTAITRAVRKVYFVNFREGLFL